MTEPTTEAGRRLLDWHITGSPKADRKLILAIEAEARATVPGCRCTCYGCRAADHDETGT